MLVFIYIYVYKYVYIHIYKSNIIYWFRGFCSHPLFISFVLGLPNYTVGNQAPTITSSVTNGEKKMEQKPSPVSSTPTTKKVKAISYFENIVKLLN